MTLVHYGELFRLRWVSRKRGIAPLYLVSAEKGGHEFYPRLGSAADAVLLRFAGAHDQSPAQPGQAVSDRATVQLQTSEAAVGAANTIGAWRSDHFLHYHPPGKREQDWQLEVDGHAPDGKLRAGQLVLLTSRNSDERRMARDAREPDYLSLDPAANGSWQIELGPSDSSS